MRYLLFLFTLTLVSGQTVLTPSNPSVASGKSITLTSSAPVTWSLNGRGTLSNITPTSALYTAPTGVVAKNQMQGCPAGPNDSIFNTRIDALPVNSKSSAWINGATSNQVLFEVNNWGVSTADAATPTRTMRTYYSNATLPNFVMPAPGPNLKRQYGAYVGTFAVPSPADHHVLTVRRTDCTFYETYDDYLDGKTQACRDGSPGCNVQTAVTYASMDYQVPGPDGGTNAAGVPLAPTTWQLSEIESGTINHATVFTTNAAAILFGQLAWPASTTAGGCVAAQCPSAMPMGVRLRLKSSFNAAAVCNSGVAREDAACNTMLTALKQYGMILCDTGTANAVQLMSDVTEDPAVAAAVVELTSARMPFTNFEAVDESSLQVSPASYQVCPLGQACLNGVNSYVAPSDQVVLTATSLNGTSVSTPIGIQAVSVGLGVPPMMGIAAGSYSFQIPYWVNGATDQGVTWTVASGAGSVTASGLYTPPATTGGAGVTQLTVLKGVSNADSASTVQLLLNVLPTASGTIRIDTGSPISTTDANGNVWAADIGIDGGATAVPNDYPHWNKTNPAASVVYESLQYGADIGNTIAVPNGTYNVHLLFGMPANGDCHVCGSWLTPAGPWNQYNFAPFILETQGQVQNATFDFGAASNYMYQTPVDAYVPAVVTNNLLQVYVRSVMSDLMPYSVPLNSQKLSTLNGLEIIPVSVTSTPTPSPSPSPAPAWTINTGGQTAIALGQTLSPFSVVAVGSAPNDPAWSIQSGPGGASLQGSTLSLAANANPNGVPIVVKATDGTYSATASIATPSTTPKAATPNPFAYQRTLTISHTSVGASDLTDFPVVVSITDPTLASHSNGGHVLNDNGYDIVLASDAAGANLLKWEVEGYNPANGKWIAHVLIPQLSHSSDNTIYLLYGNSQIATSQAAPANVWDANYSGVYHFEAPPLTGKDSTANGNSAVKASVMYTSAGLIAGGVLGSTGSLSVPAPVLDEPTGTIEAWVNTALPQDTGHTWYLVSQAGSATKEQFHLGWNGADGQFEAAWFSTGGATSRLGFSAANAPITEHGWTHVAYTWDLINSFQSLYLNGVLLGSSTQYLPVQASSNIVSLGNAGTATPALAFLDEIRFSHVVRTSDWIAADYNAQSAPAKFVIVGAEVSTGSN